MGADDSHQQQPSSQCSHDLPLYVEDSIGAMVYSMIGQTTDEEHLRYHLSLSQNSCRFLEAQLRELLSQHQILLQTLDASKVSFLQIVTLFCFCLTLCFSSSKIRKSENGEGENALVHVIT
jgi:hypothetical protein